MASILAVAEKPSVARAIAAIVGHNQAHSRNGSAPNQKVFDIPNCDFRGTRAKMTVTSVRGHMTDLDFDAAYRSWNGPPIESLFVAPVHKTIKSDMESLKKTLIDESKKCNILFLWLDCDLEGEAISYEVIEICLKSNPRLDIFRARFSALMERDIFRAMNYPERPNPHMNDAVMARQEIDLRIGAAFTRFQSLHLRGKYGNSVPNVISYGPCQFPTLGFVFEQFDKIQRFRPENFWYITLELETNDPESVIPKQMCTTFTWDRVRIYDQVICILIYEKCVMNCVAQVMSCTARPTSKNRPCPLNLIELQKRASKWYRLRSLYYFHLSLHACLPHCLSFSLFLSLSSPLHFFFLSSISLHCFFYLIHYILSRFYYNLQYIYYNTIINITHFTFFLFCLLHLHISHFSGEDTLKCAQNLYEAGLVSYPRTDTTVFKEDTNIKELLHDHRDHSDWGEYTNKLLDPVQNYFIWPSNGGNDDGAHPPIHPLKSVPLESLHDTNQRNIYELITKHFLACCSPDAIGNQTDITVQVSPSLLPFLSFFLFSSSYIYIFSILSIYLSLLFSLYLLLLISFHLLINLISSFKN